MHTPAAAVKIDLQSSGSFTAHPFFLICSNTTFNGHGMSPGACASISIDMLSNGPIFSTIFTS